MTPDIDSEVGGKVVQNFFDVWINPEIARRRAQGNLPEGFVLRGAQVIFNMDAAPTQVRLNEQVRGIMHAESINGAFEL